MHAKRLQSTGLLLFLAPLCMATEVPDWSAFFQPGSCDRVLSKGLRTAEALEAFLRRERSVRWRWAKVIVYSHRAGSVDFGVDFESGDYVRWPHPVDA